MPPDRDLFANFERMRREIDELFGDVFERTGFAPRRGFSPRVDVFYSGEPPRATVKAELAGVDIDEVGIEIRGRQLVIAGQRRPSEATGRVYQQIEIEHGAFRRVVELGAEVVADRARATYEDGVLEVEIPLARTEDDVRRVPIEAGDEEGEEAVLAEPADADGEVPGAAGPPESDAPKRRSK